MRGGTALILGLQRQRQVDLSEFEANLVYIESSSQPKMHSATLVSNERTYRPQK